MSLASSNSRNVRHGIFTLTVLVLALALVPQAAEAQTTVSGWLPKFNCGFYPGSIPLLSDPNPIAVYEDFKPGNYATAINLFNLSTETKDFFVYVLKTNFAAPGSKFLLGRLPIEGIGGPNSPNLMIGCRIITALIGLVSPATVANGAGVEGHLLIIPADIEEPGELQVDAFYSMASQNASAEGGLGLGASVDHERIEPVQLSNAAAAAMAESAKTEAGAMKLLDF